MATSDEASADRQLTGDPQLPREVGVFGATMVGLGSIIGTGIFVSIAIAAQSAGPAVVLAIAAAAVVAALNGSSSAQLAATYPVSGGTYEYAYRLLHPALGFAAGWTFLCAKCASAATAALGLAGYTLYLAGASGSTWLVPLALGVVGLLTILVLSGIRRSSTANIAIVSVTLLALVTFLLALLPTAARHGGQHLVPFFRLGQGAMGPLPGILEACALMFVAYTGYGRIATLGEEIRQPRRNIPWAIVVTLAISMTLYVSVALVAVAAVGVDRFAAGVEQAAPLVAVARQAAGPAVGLVVAVGAVTAMAGVLLNLLLGLSRVLLAMGRRGDMPAIFGKLNRAGTAPLAAVIGVGLAVAGLTLAGDIRTTWSFSAFTVLVYYALTNLAATRLDAGQRLFPPAVPWTGLVACVGLAFFIEPRIWIAGTVLIAAGLVWRQAARHWATRRGRPAG